MRTRTLLLVGAAALVASSACTGQPPPPPRQRPAPNTGYIGFVVMEGRPLIFTPAEFSSDGWTPIAVLDAAAPDGQDGLLSYIDLGPTAEPSAVGADGNDVVVSDGGSPTVYFIDAATRRVTGSAPLPQGERFFVSGTNLYASGVAVDAAKRRAWVSYSGGIAEYDLDARALRATYAAPHTENFNYDPAAGLLYLPFYLCDPNGTSGGCDPYAQPGGPDITDSLTVVSVATGTTSFLVDPTAPDPHAPLGFEADAAALDPDLRLLAVTVGKPVALQVLSAAPVFDDATRTCRMPGSATIALPPGDYSPVTVDSASHVAVLAEEIGPGLAIADLTGVRPWPGHLLQFSMPNLPDGQAWASRADPHGITIGVIGGRSYVLLYDVRRRVMARIDVAMVAALTSADQAAFASAVAMILLPATPPR